MMHALFAALPLLWTVIAPVTNMRELPEKNAEIVSQAYYSEDIKIIEETADWAKIETVADHYQGWTPKSALSVKQHTHETAPTIKVNRCVAHIYDREDTVYGPILTVPFDSTFVALEPKQPSNSRWIKIAMPDGKEAYIQRGDITFEHAELNRNEMCTLSFRFLNLPYTWGGRSSFGYDCSGFVQMLYRQMGISIPRDSKDQMVWAGFTEISFDQLQPGDLIFFGLAEDKIRHVGLALGENQFIHSTVAENMPYIRISSLSDPEWNGSGRFVYRSARQLKH